MEGSRDTPIKRRKMNGQAESAALDPILRALLACPLCHAALCWGESAIECPDCQARYPILKGIPLMFPGSEAAADLELGARLYDRIAEDYDGTIPQHVMEHYLKKRVRLVQEHLRSGAILDVGCGTGRLGGRLDAQGYKVVGLDASLGMLRVTQREGAVIAVAGYSHALPFRTESFQMTLSVASLHHIADAERVAQTLHEMHRVTERGGYILIWDHNPKNPYWPLIMRRVPQDLGLERLIPLSEILAAFQEGISTLEAKKMGFVPDFIPRPLLAPLQILEALVEWLPGLREVAAHNVVLARKA